ncbi:beta-N-acetylhexosaminidase [Gulosibacter faecalis]|uniref:Glycoside hydrolase family 20 protein n=1 Tax=Gulosibacter faecalis TaxID=272240 RepID=A0ABW5UZB4_9MICO|nr:glycoside hydrolase family 20 protein [Gulosibacter faecalis]
MRRFVSARRTGNRRRRSRLGIVLAVVAGLVAAGPLAAAASPTPSSPGSSAAPAQADAALTMLPPPTSHSPGDGPAWAPSPATRILFTDPSLDREAARLAEELAALGLTSEPPALLGVDNLVDSNLAVEEAGPDDIVLTLGDAAVLETTPDGVIVSGTDAAGVFRATRPLLQQLVGGGSLPNGAYAFGVGSSSSDAPEVFAVHLDIARKHYPIETLEALLTQLSWVGVTEFELHFSENEGFAIESTTHPDIASPDAHTQAEIREFIAFANDLHIRVVPSLDMPGHLDHALESYPDLRLRDAAGGEVFGALDVTTEAGVDFAHDLIGEYAELFAQPDMPGPVPWNLGADEFVAFDNASEVATLTAAAQAEHGPEATAYDALTDFVNDTAALLADAGYQPRVWSDGMLRGSVVELDESVEVAYWTQRPPGAVPASEFAAQGYRLINVNDEYLYFVLGERVGYAYPTGEAILGSWNATVYPSVGGQPDLIDESSGAMFAIWSDIPDAFEASELVDRVRAPVAAMAVKLADPSTGLTFAEFETQLAAIGEAPAVRPPQEPDFETLEPQPSPVATPAQPAPADAESPPAWLFIGAGILAAAAFVIALIAVGRARRR